MSIESHVTPEAVAILEAEEIAALKSYRDARGRANDARASMVERKLQDAGIVIGETVCIAPKWGFSERETVRVIVISAGIDGDACCAPVTKANKIHGRRGKFYCPMAEIKAEAAV